ncbi:uncharacterized protein G2W53_011022 [Senna tora]|uniref:Uncharacterized protein n=1 Tax=Senna tora TaxID=362788 RepID=A0A834X100_9FABA|nr:uncharacterized protein G2W53_011022 [Senna tora]
MRDLTTFACRAGGCGSGGGGVVLGSDFAVGGAGVEEFSGEGGGGGVVVEGRDGGEAALGRERVEFIVMVRGGRRGRGTVGSMEFHFHGF